MIFRERPIIRMDLQIRTTFGFGWVGFGKPDVRISSEEKIRTPTNTVLLGVQKCTYFYVVNVRI